MPSGDERQSEDVVWPPAIARPPIPPPEPLSKSKSEIWAIKNRWYYLFMAAFSAWFGFHEYRKYGGFVLNVDLFVFWFPPLCFSWLTLQSWRLHLRTRYERRNR